MDGLAIEVRKAAGARSPSASRLLRDFIADWARWSVRERVAAATLAVVLSVGVPLAHISLALNSAS